ncbi:MAG: insulinase family protein [Bacillota bacterium]|nr:MAG: insulinase family protein [Bacillota bacterium]
MLYIKNDFKTIQMTLFFTDLDQNEKSVYRFLLPRLLTTHTDSIRSKKDMSTVLEDLYGAYFKPKLERLGNLSIASVTLTLVDPKIIGSQTLFQDALSVFKKVIYEHSSFDQDIFNEEKRMLLEQWETLFDKKRQYALHKFNELFFENDTYGYPLSGSYDDIKKLTKEKLEDYYVNTLLKNNMRFIVSGNLSDEEITQLNALGFPEEAFELTYETTFRDLRPLVEKREQTVMQQAIIKMGYHIPIFRGNPLYMAANLLDDMIGGYPDSRLFLEIRERLGLCYDIQSGYDPYRGVLMISSGVDTNQIDKAIDAIKYEIEKIIQEGPSEEELTHAKSYFSHQLKSSLDNQSINIKRLYLENLLGYTDSIEKRLNDIEHVTLEDIKKVSSLLKLDTIYVLHGGQDENNPL